ncbi:MAG: hypothetical protein K1000chlam2_00904 [Chlamydiae bacterium]|nr:hypothetical protein [Chlamydiota bacterium]
MNSITSNQQIFPFMELPVEIQLEPVKKCDIHTFLRLSSASKHTQSLTDFCIKQLHLPPGMSFTKYFQYLREKGKNLSSNPRYNASDLTEIEYSTFTIDKIFQLQNYLKARDKTRDTLIVWEALAKQIHQSSPQFENGGTSDDIIKEAERFNSWCNQHKSALANVIHLDLARHDLTSLPEEVSNLPLETLNLELNHFTSLPDSLSSIKSLETLRLSENQLSLITPDFLKLKDLVIVFIMNGYFCSAKVSAVLDYLDGQNESQ